MTISMSQVQTIRQLKKEGESIAGISRKVGVSRDTVYKYLERDDFSLAMPVKKPAKSIMDEYRPVIEGYFEEDARSWRKQRHTAKRIHERLRDEHGCEASESTVRHYVARIRKECVPSASSFLTLVWAPGEAQADFGEADFYLNGVRTRLFYLVVTFPFSNVGLGIDHAMAHTLSAHYDTPHGVACAMLLPVAMEYNKPVVAERLADVAAAMGVDTAGMSVDEAADAAIAAVRQLSADVDIKPTCDGLVEADLDQLADDALADACFPGNPREADHAAVVELFRKVMA